MSTSLLDYLRTLTAYHVWAGERLMEAAGGVAEEDLAGGELSAGTLFETLRHVLDVGWSWRRAAEGLPESGMLWEVESLDDFASLRAYWEEESRLLEDFVTSLRADDLDREVTPAWRKEPFALWQIVSHIVTHQIEHGNEIGWRLTQLGHSPGEMALMRYLNTHR